MRLDSGVRWRRMYRAAAAAALVMIGLLVMIWNIVFTCKFIKLSKI